MVSVAVFVDYTFHSFFFIDFQKERRITKQKSKRQNIFKNKTTHSLLFLVCLYVLNMYSER